MVKITDHFERAISLLASQFREAPPTVGLTNFQKWIKVIVDMFQELDDQNYLLLTMRNLDTAEGVQLDGLGQILGLERQPDESDEDYRERLRFQIFINQSKGTPEEMIRVLTFLTKASKVWYSEVYPAMFQMTTNGLTFPDPVSELIEALHSVSPAGVQYVPVTAIYDSTSPFTFSSDPILELFYVVPDANQPLNLHQLEVVVTPDTFFLEVNRGQTSAPTFGGWFAEAYWINEPTTPEIYEIETQGAGEMAEVIQINGSIPPPP